MSAKLLRIESKDLHAKFQAICSNAPLPWERGIGHEKWSIVDANGDDVCCFDGSCADSEAMIEMIILAVNTCGGFRAEASR